MDSLDLSPEHLFSPITENFNEIVAKLPNALVTLIVGLIVIRILSKIASWLLGFIRMPSGLREIIVSILDALLMIFLIIVVLQSLGLSNVAFIFSATVAAVGLAIGNGSVTIVQDILGGIYLARDRDFSIGDIVRVGEGTQVEGEILSMDMRRTRIRSKAGHIHSIPNSVIERKEYVLITKKRDRTDLKE